MQIGGSREIHFHLNDLLGDFLLHTVCTSWEKFGIGPDDISNFLPVTCHVELAQTGDLKHA